MWKTQNEHSIIIKFFYGALGMGVFHCCLNSDSLINNQKVYVDSVGRMCYPDNDSNDV
jgi:hypothetical protein